MIHVCRGGYSRLLRERPTLGLVQSHNLHNAARQQNAVIFGFAAHGGSIWHNATRPTSQKELGYGFMQVNSARTYTRNKKAIRKSQKEVAQAAYSVNNLVRFKNALEDGNLDAVASAYLNLPKDINLGGDDVTAIAQTLHRTLVHTPDYRNQNVSASLLAFAGALVEDIRSEKLPPSPEAYQSILLFYKDARQFAKGFEFWSWLAFQGDEYLSFKVYAAAIQSMAVEGRPGEEIEEMYIEALRRFPASFAEYHLSPDAVVPDRSQEFNIRGIPLKLHLAIITARLLRGDSRRAYLGLDAALRLSPTKLPHQVFATFIEERPVTEAYKVFQLSYHSGVILLEDSVKTLLRKLREVVEMGPAGNGLSLRATVTTIALHIAGGGKLAASHLTEILVAVSSVMQTKGFSRCSTEHLQPLTDRLWDISQRLISLFKGQNVEPSIAAYNVLISNLAGRGKRPDLLTLILNELGIRGLQPSAITHRSVLSAAGLLQDREIQELAWRNLVSKREAGGKPPPMNDWQLLASSVSLSENSDFFNKQMEELAHAITPHLAKTLPTALQHRERNASMRTMLQEAPPEVAGLQKLLDVVTTDIQVLESVIDGTISGKDLASKIPRSLGAESINTLADDGEQKMRQLYDELTTEAQSRQKGELDQMISAEQDGEQHQIDSAEQDGEQHQTDSAEQDGTQDQTNSAEQDGEQHQTNSAEQDGELQQSTKPQLEPALSQFEVPFDELRLTHWQAINELLVESNMYDRSFDRKIDQAIGYGVTPAKKEETWMEVCLSLLAGRRGGLSDFVNGKSHDEGVKDGVEARVTKNQSQLLRMVRDPETILQLRGRTEWHAQSTDDSPLREDNVLHSQY